MELRHLFAAATVGAASLFTASAQAASLTTLFDSNNGQDGAMFNIDVFNDLTITGWDVNFEEEGNQDIIEIYWREGTFLGNENSSAGWTLLGDETFTSAGDDNPTPISLGGLELEGGKTYGLYLTGTDALNDVGMEYTNTAPVLDLDVGDIYVSNSDLAIKVGHGKEYAFDDSFDPRLWNGTIYYDLKEGPGEPTIIPTPAAAPAGLLLLGALGLRRRRASRDAA